MKTHPAIELNQIHEGDCQELLRALPANMVDLTVTSPPYDKLRDYHGYSFDFKAIAAELYRVTKPGGVVVWVVGDATVKGSETGNSFRQALYFMECGFNLHDTMIYGKQGPPQTRNRYEPQFEFMFVLSKCAPVTFNALREPSVHAGKTKSGRIRRWDDELTARYGKEPIADTKARGNIWHYGVGGSNYGHPAIFPERLAQDHILSWSNPGEVVLDPFSGSGTTAKMALVHGRKYLGFEISSEYVQISRSRLASVHPALDFGLPVTHE